MENAKELNALISSVFSDNVCLRPPRPVQKSGAKKIYAG